MRVFLASLVFAPTLLTAQTAHQPTTRTAAVAFRRESAGIVDSIQKQIPRAQRLLGRSLSGIGGSVAGAFVGGSVGYFVWPHGDCGDDPGLCELLAGATAGAILGLTLGAALPRLASTCRFGRRFTWSVFGSTLAGALGYAVGGRSRYWLAAATPVGAVVGAAVGADACTRTKAA
jgi:hypothetical protein